METVQDAFTIVAAATASGAFKVLLDETQLPEAFFAPDRAFADSLIWRLVCHRIRVAAVFAGRVPLPADFAQSLRSRYGERRFRSFDDPFAAVAWLDSHR